MRRQDDLSRARRLLACRCPTHGTGLLQEGVVSTRAGDCTLFTAGCPRRDCTFIGLCVEPFGPVVEIRSPEKAATFTIEDTLEDLVAAGCVSARAVARLLAQERAKSHEPRQDPPTMGARDSRAEPPAPKSVARSAVAPEAGAAALTNAKGSQKTRAAFYLPVDLLEQARDAVVALRGPPVRLTLTALVENALRAELLRLNKQHNEGQPFPKRQDERRGGRPLGS